MLLVQYPGMRRVFSLSSCQLRKEFIREDGEQTGYRPDLML